MSLLPVILASASLFASFSQPSAKIPEDSLKEMESIDSQQLSSTHKIVFSYLDLFRDYYESEDAAVKAKVSFEDFCSGYYEQDLPINDYVVSVKNSFILSDSEPTVMTETSRSLEILSPDEDYIMSSSIGNSNYTEMKYFKHPPQYGLFDLSELMMGDIILETLGAGGLGHMAFLTNTHQAGYYGYYFQTIESVAGGVQYGYLDDNRILDFGVTIYRVYRASELGVTTNAKSFLQNHLGDSYSYDFTCTHVENTRHSWYCSELVYAAYYNAYMDILYVPGVGNFNHEKVPFLPNTLMRSSFFGSFFFDTFLYISLESFGSSTWRVRVSNLTGADLTVKYNCRMCFLNDGKTWSHLGDIRTISLSKKQTITVSVHENFFADSIAFSYVKEDSRYITSANCLDKEKKTLNTYYTRIAGLTC